MVRHFIDWDSEQQRNFDRNIKKLFNLPEDAPVIREETVITSGGIYGESAIVTIKLVKSIDLKTAENLINGIAIEDVESIS